MGSQWTVDRILPHLASPTCAKVNMMGLLTLWRCNCKVIQKMWMPRARALVCNGVPKNRCTIVTSGRELIHLSSINGRPKLLAWTRLFQILLHSSWLYLTLLDSTWLYLTLLDSTRLYLTLLDPTWLYLTLLDSTWLYLTVPNSTWLFLTLLNST